MKVSIIILISIYFFIASIYGLYLIYRAQITEYRWFRFKAMLKDAGWKRVLFPTKFYRPALSVRNLLIFGIYEFFVIFLLALTWFYWPVFLIAILFFIPFAFLFLWIGNWATFPFVFLKRNRIIKQAKSIIKQHEPIVIGITGSYGKSSVKQLLAEVLSTKYKVIVTKGNRNTDIGVALDIIEQKESLKYSDIYIVEMGAYIPGEIRKITNFVEPNIGIVTGIGNQHIGLFGSIENLVNAKAELLEALPCKDGLAVINADNKFVKTLADKTCAVVLKYGLFSKEGVFSPTNIKSKELLQTFELKLRKKVYKFQTMLLGKHNVVNLTACILVADYLNIPIEKLQQKINTILPIKQKLSIHYGVNNTLILNDSYNSNVNGFIEALDVLNTIGKRKAKVVISNGIFELGNEKAKSYEMIVNNIKKVNDFKYLLTTDKLLSDIANKRGIVSQVFSKEFDIIKFLEEERSLNSDSVVLLEGRFSPTMHNFLQI